MELFHTGLEEIDALKNSASSEVLHAFFRKRMQEWPHPMISFECGTVGTFCDLVDKLKPEIAFELIPVAVDIVCNSANADLETKKTAVSLLWALIRKSDTTEIPNKMEALINDLINDGNASIIEEGKELKRWYRL